MRLTTILTVLALVFVMAACSASSGQFSATPTPLPTPVLPTFTVQQGSLAQEVVLAGHIQPVLIRSSAFERDGKIGNVYAFSGDAVRKGQVLAELADLESLQSDLVKARQAAEESAEAERKSLRRLEIALEIAQLNLTLAQRNGSPEEQRIRELQLELAQMDLEEMQQQIADRLHSDEVQRLEAEIEKSRLLAVMDGVLLDEIKPGQNVRADAPLASIGDPSRLELNAALVNPTEISSLREGMKVTLWLEQNPRVKLSGLIRQLPAPYGTGEPSTSIQKVFITIDQPAQQAGYTLSDVAQAVAVVANIPDAIWLPPQALRSVGGITFVFIQGSTGPQRVNVTTGIFNREQVQILEGLEAGQTVIAP